MPYNSFQIISITSNVILSESALIPRKRFLYPFLFEENLPTSNHLSCHRIFVQEKAVIQCFVPTKLCMSLRTWSSAACLSPMCKLHIKHFPYTGDSGEPLLVPHADSQGSGWIEMTLALVKIKTANSGNLKVSFSECTHGIAIAVSKCYIKLLPMAFWIICCCLWCWNKWLIRVHLPVFSHQAAWKL